MRELSPIKKIAVIDLETGSKKPEAHIFSVGVTVVDVEALVISDQFYYRCSDYQPGRIKDADTLGWWLKQAPASPDAFYELFQSSPEQATPLDEVLLHLVNFLKSQGDPKTVHLMGNGPEFDNVIIEHAIEQAGLKMPVPYWNGQSLRTIKLVHRLLNGDMAINALEAMPFDGIKHHAGDDAHHEAEQLLTALKAIRGYQAYDQEISELKQELQQQKMVYAQKLKEFEGNDIVDFESILEQANAWQSVCKALELNFPGWMRNAKTAKAAAVYTIQQLAPKTPERISLPDGPVNEDDLTHNLWEQPGAGLHNSYKPVIAMDESTGEEVIYQTGSAANVDARLQMFAVNPDK